MNLLTKIKEFFFPKKEKMYWFWYDDWDWYNLIVDYAKKHNIDLNHQEHFSIPEDFAYMDENPWIEVLLPGNYGRMIILFDWNKSEATWSFVDKFEEKPFFKTNSYIWDKEQDSRYRNLNMARNLFIDLDYWFERYNRLYTLKVKQEQSTANELQ
jgi:hypothetical protein